MFREHPEPLDTPCPERSRRMGINSARDTRPPPGLPPPAVPPQAGSPGTRAPGGTACAPRRTPTYPTGRGCRRRSRSPASPRRTRWAPQEKDRVARRKSATSFPIGSCRRILNPIWRHLTACQTLFSVGVSGWRKSRERWRMAGRMRWSFPGQGMHGLSPLARIPGPSERRNASPLENQTQSPR